eukprot:scaffold28279_cov134-Isochrysis_galbana.AAC.3
MRLRLPRRSRSWLWRWRNDGPARRSGLPNSRGSSCVGSRRRRSWKKPNRQKSSTVRSTSSHRTGAHACTTPYPLLPCTYARGTVAAVGHRTAPSTGLSHPLVLGRREFFYRPSRA